MHGSMRRFLVLSLVAHALLLWLVGRVPPDRPSGPLHQSIHLRLLEPAVAAHDQRPAARPRMSTPQRKAPVVTAHTTAPSSESLAPRATTTEAASGGTVALAPTEVARLSRPTPHAGAVLEQAQPSTQEAIAGNVAGAWRLRNNAAFGARGALADLSHALKERFRPHPKLQHAQQSHLEAVLQQWKNELMPGPREHAGTAVVQDASPQARSMLDIQYQNLQLEFPGLAAGKIMFCFGNCGQKHVIARLSAWIRVDHDAIGKPFGASVAAPSGVPEFDRYCLESASGLAELRLHTTEADPVPEWSMWRFEQVVYRFNRLEQLLDYPAFKLPGKVDHERSDILGTASIDTQVSFVTAQYRAR